MTVTIYRSTDGSAPSLTGQAGGLIPVLDAILVNGYGTKPSMGWTKAFSGTNKAAYRQRTDIANGRYLRIDDTPTVRARMVGYENMTDVDTGTGKFPTEAAQAGGLYWEKSSTSDATARPWFCITNNKIFYFFGNYNSGDWSGAVAIAFGDITSFKPNDPWNTIIFGDPGASNVCYLGYISVNTTYGMWICRDYAGAAPAAVGSCCDYYMVNAAWFGAGTPAYPDPVSGGFLMGPARVIESVMYRTRGMLPGIWADGMSLGSMANGDTISGMGILSGKTFEARIKYGTSRIMVETSDTWEDYNPL